MSALLPHEQGSAFLRLPVEIRLQIYSHLFSKSRIDINLCQLDISEPTQDLLPPSKRRKRSPISSMVSQNLTIETITRSNGLHLLLVSRRTAAELTAVLSNTAVRFHCPKCFERWLRSVSYGLGVGINWLKRIEILCDLETEFRPMFSSLRDLTRSLSRFMVHETMKQCQQTAYAYYGRMDLSEPPRDKWEYEAVVGEEPIESSLVAQAMLPGNATGALPSHSWVLNRSFPAPGTSWPIPHGTPIARLGLHQGLQQPLTHGLNTINDQRLEENGPATRNWIIKGRFDV